MRVWKGLIAGALALGGLVFAQGQASARPMTAPELIQASPVQTAPAGGVAAPTCQWGHHGWRRGYGWHPRYGYRPRWHRPYYGYGWHRPYYGYGWHRPHYGWHRGWRHYY